MPTGVLPAAAVLAVGAYLALAVPRLPSGVRGGLSAALVAIGTLAAVGIGPAWAWPTIALAAGHLGWAWWTRARRQSGESRASEPVAGRSAGGPTDPVPPRPMRQTLGRYRLERELGRGTSGVVYLGHDRRLGDAVAIKTMALAREFSGRELDEARARFFREAETAGRLRHPDIVAVRDAGEERGVAFIAMEYLRGTDLSAHTSPGTLLPVPTVLATLERVARALAHAHAQGVVHRDVKPANVMLDPAADQVKVTDFGIASFAESARTRTGLLLGTPSFMSPEQLAGRRVDGRSDLYALGVMLFQLLTGALPHRSDSMAALLQQIANQPAPNVRSLRPELPEALADVVARALQKRPEMRHPDGVAFADDLAAVAKRLAPPPAQIAPATGTSVAASSDDAAQSRNFAAAPGLSSAEPRHNS